jgi:hypothetical protein
VAPPIELAAAEIEPAPVASPETISVVAIAPPAETVAPPVDVVARVYAKTRFVWVRYEPSASAGWLGYLWLGGSAELRDPKPIIGGTGCNAWYAVKPRGYVCADGDGATLDPNDPTLVALRPLAPDLASPYPHRYAESRGAERYMKLPTAEEQRAREWDLPQHKERLIAAASGKIDPALEGIDLTPGSSTPFLLPDVPSTLRERRRRMNPLSTVAYSRDLVDDGRSYLVTADFAYVPKDRTVPYPAPTFHGTPLGQGVDLPLAFFRERARPKYVVEGDGVRKIEGGFERLSFIQLTGRTRTLSGIAYLETKDPSVLVDPADATVVKSQPATPWGAPVGEEDKTAHPPAGRRTWMEVSVLGGWAIAFEGTRPVYATLISPGRGGIPVRDVDPLATASTPTGTFPITGKFATATMVAPGEFIHSDVPWTQNFHGPHALHGAYWHDGWGEKKSAGCINVSPIDGRWLYHWTEPEVPAGWHGFRWDPDQGPSTVMVVHRLPLHCLGEVLVEADGAAGRLVEVGEGERLVLAVGVGVGIFDADEERRDAAELLGEGFDERDGGAAANGDRFAPVPFRQRTEGGLEGRVLRRRVPGITGRERGHGHLDTPGRHALQMLGQGAEGLVRLHVGDDAEAHASPGGVDQDVARLLPGARLDGVDRNRRHSPQHLERMLSVGEHRGLREQSRLVADLLDRERYLGERRALGVRHGANLLRQRRDHPSLIVDERGEHPRERHRRVGNGPAPHTGMDRSPERAHLDLHRHEATERGGDRGEARVVIGGVGQDDGVGGEELPVLPEERGEVAGADLLLPLDDDLHVHRELSHRREPRVHGGGVDHDAGLVVCRAPSVEPPLALLGYEGIRPPLREIARRLDVVVRVEKQRRRARTGVEPVGVDVGVSPFHLEEARVLEATRGEELLRRLRALPHPCRVEPGKGHAGDAGQRDQILQRAGSVRFLGAEGGLSAHRVPFSSRPARLSSVTCEDEPGTLRTAPTADASRMFTNDPVRFQTRRIISHTVFE